MMINKEREMFELETIMKGLGSDVDCDIPLTADACREIIAEFSELRTALRRIRSLDDKNLKYAKQIASQALAMPNVQ